MNERRWYIVQTYSGYENSVEQDLKKRIETMGQQDYIFQVLVPEEEYWDEKKDGSKVLKKRKIFPSYVFVEMIVNEKSWFIVRNTPKVTGFLGSSGKGAKPVPIPPGEIEQILKQAGLVEKKNVEFEVGEIVDVVSGPFAGRTIEITAIDNTKETLTFMIEMFNRLTPAEVQFDEVVKKAQGEEKPALEEQAEQEEPQTEDEYLDEEAYDEEDASYYDDEDEEDEYLDYEDEYDK